MAPFRPSDSASSRGTRRLSPYPTASRNNYSVYQPVNATDDALNFSMQHGTNAEHAGQPAHHQMDSFGTPLDAPVENDHTYLSRSVNPPPGFVIPSLPDLPTANNYFRGPFQPQPLGHTNMEPTPTMQHHQSSIPHIPELQPFLQPNTRTSEVGSLYETYGSLTLSTSANAAGSVSYQAAGEYRPSAAEFHNTPYQQTVPGQYHSGQTPPDSSTPYPMDVHPHPYQEHDHRSMPWSATQSNPPTAAYPHHPNQLPYFSSFRPEPHPQGSEGRDVPLYPSTSNRTPGLGAAALSGPHLRPYSAGNDPVHLANHSLNAGASAWPPTGVEVPAFDDPRTSHRLSLHGRSRPHSGADVPALAPGAVNTQFAVGQIAPASAVSPASSVQSRRSNNSRAGDRRRTSSSKDPGSSREPGEPRGPRYPDREREYVWPRVVQHEREGKALNNAFFRLLLEKAFQKPPSHTFITDTSKRCLVRREHICGATEEALETAGPFYQWLIEEGHQDVIARRCIFDHRNPLMNCPRANRPA